ncbi:MAG: hypothetical protein OXF06_09415 [Bacteroidetes bacterium]|nr:hypothetical protein [Bacteroidota bacterium]MCY4225041.1 hypothetical protein [Bacteroidota bacterium]
MNQALATVIGMTIAYAASFLGLILAYRAWRKHHKNQSHDEG